MKRLLLAALVLGASSCGTECEDNYRRCTDDRGEDHCVARPYDCGTPGKVICPSMVCSDEGADYCSLLMDNEDCGGCGIRCPEGTQCDNAECVPVPR